MDQLFGEYIPIWSWPPFLVGGFILGLDFGVVMFIRILLERKRYLTRWWTFKIGDTVGLPIFAIATAYVIGGHKFSGIYTEWWWHLAIFIFGIAFWKAVEIADLKSGLKTTEDLAVASEFYHTLVFGPIFYIVVSALIPLSSMMNDEPVGFTLAILGLGIYSASLVVDNLLGDHETPYSHDRQ